MNPGFLLLVLALWALIQITALGCLFIIGFKIEKLVKTAKFVQEHQIPGLSAQLQEISARLAELASRQ